MALKFEKRSHKVLAIAGIVLVMCLVVLFDRRAQREKLLNDLTPQQRTWYYEGKSLDEIARLSWAEAEKTKEAGTGEGRPDDSAKSRPVVAE
jgi:hypothetical protein